jgi:signal transduction histidine kinase
MPLSRRRSLAIKIPLILSLLLLAALTAMSVASYLELRRALTEVSTERLQQAAAQMAAVLSSAGQRAAVMEKLMASPELREYLQSRRPELEPSIAAALNTYLGAAASIANVELWDPEGRRLLSTGAAFDEVSGPLLDEYKKDLAHDNDAAIGRLRMSASGIQYPVGGRIIVDGKPIGYVVERRGINPAQTRQTVQLLTAFIGSDASMVVGNADGSMWTDLESVLADVPITPADQRLWDYQRANRRRVFAWATAINSTPWAVAIEFPRDVVLAPSERLIVRSLLIALVLLLLTAAAGWWFTRQITDPLVRVAEAAEAVADLKPHVRVDTNREDEIGSLADSFNTMAERIEHSRGELELRVEQRTAELRAANRELEAFSYSVSHDLRAPLRAIAGFVQILDEDHGPSLDPEARKHLERVKANARRMGQLIDDLLNFSRIGRTTMLRQNVDMNAVARTVAEDAIAASGRKIELTVDPLPHAHGEPALVNQVLVNLVSNAIKFTARSDNAAIRIGARTENGENAYFVRDNGVGFDERYADKLFGVFQRLHRVSDFEGTGVGLAIVQRIVHRHGGRVWAEGKVNAGATFYFTLPPATAVEQ